MSQFDDAERVLKQELAELHVMFHRQAAPILNQLARLEAMKPPRPIWLDLATADPAVLAMLKPTAPADPAKEGPNERFMRLEYERGQLLHLLRMVRSAVPDALPGFLGEQIERALEDWKP